MKHIPDIGKMVSDTPRTNNYDWSFHLLFAEAQTMERELNAANERIKRLEDIIEKASKHFRSAGPNAFTAHEMANVLKEAKP